MVQSVWKAPNVETLSIKEALQYSLDIAKNALQDKEKANKAAGLDRFAHLPDICVERWEDGDYVGSNQRRIVSAANRFTVEGSDEIIIIASSRHYDPLMNDHVMRYKRLGLKLSRAYGDNQGFIDQHRNYWTREEAWTIAEYAGQIRHDVSSAGELYSENLYQ